MKKLTTIILILISLNLFSQEKFATKQLFKEGYLNDTSLGVSLNNTATNGKSNFMFVSGGDTSYIMTTNETMKLFSDSIQFDLLGDSIYFCTVNDTTRIKSNNPILIDSLKYDELWTQTGSDIYYNDGNVGIGTATPSEKLEINGGKLQITANNAYLDIYESDVPTTDGHFKLLNITGSANNFSSAIFGRGNSASFPGFGFYGDLKTGADNGTIPILQFSARQNNTLVAIRPLFAFNNYGATGTGVGVTVMQILANGNVGIGTTIPDSLLTVDGSGHMDYLLLDNYIDIDEDLIQFSGVDFLKYSGYSISLGVGAGENDDGTNNFNTFIGYMSGNANTTGSTNNFFGYNSGLTNTIGRHNTFIGHNTGYTNLTGTFNTFIGSSAGYLNSVGINNIFIGYGAGYNELDSNKLYIEATTSTTPLIYGEFDNNYLSFNAKINVDSSIIQFDGSDFLKYSGYTISLGVGAGENDDGTNNQNTFIGYYAGYSNTSGYGNIAIGTAAGQGLTNGSYSSIIGLNSGNSIGTGVSNTILGAYSGQSITGGDSNIFIGNRAGTKETGSNKLIIANQSYSSEANARDSSLIYAEMDKRYLKLNADSVDFRGAIAQYHRMDTIDSHTASVWRTVKFDTLIENESTYGYVFNSDSTGFYVSFDGGTRVQGCGHWIWRGADNQQIKFYTRVLINNVEAKCLQSNDTRGKKTDDTGMIPFIGTIHHTSGQEIKLQYQVSNADLGWEGSPVFDDAVSFSINFEKINND